jgi:hypothetical protein
LVLLAPAAQPTLSFRRIPSAKTVFQPRPATIAPSASIEAASNPISSIAPPALRHRRSVA